MHYLKIFQLSLLFLSNCFYKISKLIIAFNSIF
nr:hypothetical protein CoNPh37_CDS0163 [Staphylococcus phage S-CoN_Ph37]